MVRPGYRGSSGDATASVRAQWQRARSLHRVFERLGENKGAECLAVLPKRGLAGAGKANGFGASFESRLTRV